MQVIAFLLGMIFGALVLVGLIAYALWRIL